MRTKINSQKILEWCLYKILRSMGYGTGGDFKTSGELDALQYIKIKKVDCKNFIIFDVGAHIGAYTSCVDKLFSSKADIYAFEPCEYSFNLLHKKFNKKDNIKCYKLALADKSEKKILYSQSNNASTVSGFFRANLEKWKINDILEESVEATTIDIFCEQQKIKHINFLKVDTEGYEFMVLKGAKEMINDGSIDWIQFEFSDNAIDARVHFRTFYNFLIKKYNLYRIVRNGLYPISIYRPMYELYQTANFLAERRI